MTRLYSFTETVTVVARLSETQLSAFVEAELVRPLESERGQMFRQMDIARLELLCDLAEGYGLDEDALGVIMSLVDQLHGVRAELRAVLAALDEADPELCERVARRLREARSAAIE